MTAHTAVQAHFTGSKSSKLIAPWWHTVLFILLFLVLTVAGALFQHRQQTHPQMLQQHPHVAGLYLSLIVMEWALVLFVMKGLQRTGTTLRGVIGGRWGGSKQVAVDAALGIGLWAFWTGVQMAWSHWMGAGSPSSIGTRYPARD